ncbi:MAG TPA: FeS-binding protein, partial [Candidatus Aminicenantes bacterium]|nr:FeS-binding protein [Candidatus Aminicenantes bacterium]
MSGKAKVILRRADTYDPTLVARIIRDGLDEFGLAPRIQGKITIKPNVVMAHHKVTPSAYTRPEFLDGLLTALEEKAQGEPEISVAEKCGAAIPTSRMFRRAGYYRLRKKHRFKLRPIEEARKKTVPLQKGKVHQKIRTSREIAERDFLIYAPKLKTNALAHGLTAALKLNIGILCDGERMWNHNYNLDEKVVDLLEIGHPDFIATDAIEV